MNYGSVCSGIEAATVAWHPLGWKAAFYSEIEKFPSAVLAHHYPAVPNLGDFTTIRPDQHEPIDLLVGGTPCQSFSIAGLRGGLGDDRGNLALEYLRLADRARPRWLVWENVPGVLSSNGGRDFGAILGGMVELGYGVAYRVLDAQFCRVGGFWRAVPQRRRRVFAVGYLGDWRCAAAVLFERASLLGDSSPGREAREGIAIGALAGTSPGGGWRVGVDEAAAGQIVAHALRADGFDASEDGTGRGTPIIPIDMRQASRGEKITNNRAHGSGGAPGHGVGDPGDPAFTISERGQAIAFSCKDHGADAGEIAPTLRAMGHSGSHPNAGGQVAIAIQERAVSENLENGPQGKGYQEGIAYTLEARNKVQSVATTWAVRRLTPRECERLQGFPDDYTLIPWRGKEAPDGPRYKALGNSMAVNVMRWIGTRIEMVETLTASVQAA